MPRPVFSAPSFSASLSISKALVLARSAKNGLSAQAARQRLKTHGPNQIPKAVQSGILRRIISQLTSPLILMLILVAIIAPFIGQASDALIILFVLAFNTTLGLIQEGRASRALEALDQTFVPICTVLRDGLQRSLPSSEVTPGDVIILNEGDRIPADGRMIEVTGLRVDESSLTGESAAVTKTASSLHLPPNAPLGDIRNAGYADTLVVGGNGRLLVTAVGSNTEVGHIARALATAQTEPPLTRKVRRLSKIVALGVGAFSGILFLTGIVAGRPALTLFATVASLAVAIIPEGLPIVLTIVLARGVSRMAEKQAVVKKLHAVEGLGRVQVICTDKTGTLTTNELVVQETFTPRRGDLNHLARAALLFGGHGLRHDKDKHWRAVGDPIDAALLTFSQQHGLHENGWRAVEQQPFSYATKRRVGRWITNGHSCAYMAGSPESVLEACKETGNRRLNSAVTEMAKNGMRVIALAEREGLKPLSTTGAWRFIGLYGMSDAIRPHVRESLAWCREQNIRVVMLTGDHPITAFTLARTLDIATQREQVLSGSDLDRMTDNDLQRALDKIRVFSRITPTHKLRIVEAYRATGLITAMTGDGVNDAPALNRADIGIAMGKSGTDVAREAAHLILMDDDFSTIVCAIQEGRNILKSLRRVILYLFSTNIAEAGVVAATLWLGLPLPLLPGQIIWINLVTDSFLDVSLAFEPPHGSSLSADDQGSLLESVAARRMLLLGMVMGLGTLLFYATRIHSSPAYAQTLVLTLLVVYQWLNAWNMRSESRSLFSLSLLTNKYLIIATCAVVSLHLLAVYAPPFQRLLHTVPLAPRDLALILTVALSVVVADELWKAHRRHTATLSLLHDLRSIKL